MQAKVAIVEDDANIQNIVQAYLQKDGYETVVMDNAEDAWDYWNSGKSADMWILDIMLPGMDGYELCKKIRDTSDVPIIIISAKDEEIDKILGLELGGDDYLTKPFSPRELVARVKRLFKRVTVQREPQVEKEELQIGELIVKLDDRRIVWAGAEVEVTAKEFDMLSIFVRNQNRAFSREELLKKVWGEDYFGSDRAVDDLIKRLRKKLDGLPIETVWGYGYRMRSASEDES
ncbi:response regulator transcription factor [Radiobacillus kanasensis]|nr:response regulator transcription factor [Radiobacillus kanasensis]UFU01313.1 response regulator transcription factor [Radiobacillus kanasensis]